MRYSFLHFASPALRILGILLLCASFLALGFGALQFVGCLQTSACEIAFALLGLGVTALLAAPLFYLMGAWLQLTLEIYLRLLGQENVIARNAAQAQVSATPATVLPLRVE